MLAVHRLHAADAEDAWMQREWGEIQVAQGNYQQAATHFEARSSCFVIMLLSATSACVVRVIRAALYHSVLSSLSMVPAVTCAQFLKLQLWCRWRGS